MASPLKHQRYTAVARYAALKSHGYDPGSSAVVEAQREIKVLGAEDFVRELVASWPPLTPEQRGRLAAILAPTTAPGGDHATT